MRLWRPYNYATTGVVQHGRGTRPWVRPHVAVHTGRRWAVQATRAYYFVGGPTGSFVWTRSYARSSREKFNRRRRRR